MADLGIVLRRIARRLRPVTLQAAAASTRILFPAETYAAPPSFSLPDEFDAVKGAVNGDLALEWMRVSGARQEHLATIEYVLERAVLRHDHLFAGGYLRRFPTSRPVIDKRSGKQGPIRLSDAVLSTNVLSGLEFGHWVRDSQVTEMHGVNEGVPAVALAREPWPHEPDFRALSGLDCAYPSHAVVDRLVILDDRGNTQHWMRRFRQLRGRTRANAAGLEGRSAGPRIFLSRGANARTREPSNIEAIEAMLERIGFRTIVPSAMPASDVAVALRDAELVVSAEGSNLNHLHFFAPDGVALVCLQDPHRFYAYHKALLEMYDGRFGFIVGRGDPDAPGRHKVDLDALRRTIDLAG